MSSLPSHCAPAARQAADQAGIALARGDPNAAIRILQQIVEISPESLGARAWLTLGVARFQAGQHQSAVEALHRAKEDNLLPYAAYYLGESLFYLGQFDAAAGEFAVAGAGPAPLQKQAAARRAETLLESGSPAAFEAHAAAIRLGETAELAWGRVRAARLTRNGDAAALLRDFWLRYPEHPAAQAAEPEVIARRPATTSERLDRAQRLLKRDHAKKSLAEANLALEHATAEERPPIQLARARAYTAMRDPQSAIPPLQIASQSGDAEIASEALYLIGRAHLRQSDAPAARQAFDEAVKRYPATRTASEAAFLSAWSYFEAHDFKSCVSAFTVLEKTHPTSSHASEHHWYAGFCAFEEGQRDSAALEFETLARSQGGSTFGQQATYWRARAIEATDKGTAEQLYRQVLRAAPWSWYASGAADRLSALGVPAEASLLPPASNAVESFGSLLLDRPHGTPIDTAVALARAGLIGDADKLLQVAGKAAPGSREAEEVAAMAAALGLYGRAYSIANSRLWERAFGEHSAISVALLYPLAYADVVDPAARAEAMDRYFLWAIMRRESAFIPTAKSGARARGVMQLLTRTAQRIALVTGRKKPRPRSLYQPGEIVPLASWYLSSLAGRFGSAALAAGAYNAGTSAMAHWAKTAEGMAADEFVELMPFKETRGYVKGVIGDYLAYRAVYGTQSPRLALPQRLKAPLDGVEF